MPESTERTSNSVRLPLSTIKKLKKMKMYRRETYNDIILRLINNILLKGGVT